MKTTLKTAKFTFKTAFARCVATKILCGNGKIYAVFGCFMIDCGGWWCGYGGFNVFLRRLQGLFAVKIRCENGEMVMRCSVLMLGLLHFGFKKWRKRMRLRRLRC